MKVAICLLILNERKCLEIMLPKIYPKIANNLHYDRFIAIDGGSNDGSHEILKTYGIEVIHQSVKGRGAAVIEAINTIDVDAYIFFSPDGNEDVNDIPRFRLELESGADLVIASRMMRGAKNEEDDNFFKPRKLANKAFNLMANLLFNKSPKLYITDSINGFRAIRRSLALKLNLDAKDYTIEYQMTIRSMIHGAKIVEFPTHELTRIAGETGAKSLPTGLRFIRRLLDEIKRTAKHEI